MKRAENMALIPCLCGKEDPVKALFHCWSHESEIVAPSVCVGGHGGGVVAGTVAIVELENGQIEKRFPEQIRFIRDMEEARAYGFTRDWGRNRNDMP